MTDVAGPGAGLTVGLAAEQIAVAGRLYLQYLPGWVATDRALLLLRDRVSGFALEACLLKVAAVVQLYGIPLYAVVRMAEHVHAVLEGPDGNGAGAAGEPDLQRDAALVERLATLDARRHISFASKFAHFMFDRERFPIYDRFAVETVRWHLGTAAVTDPQHPYHAFLENLRRLRAARGVSASAAELDRYLWLAGQYREWRRKSERALLNGEARRVFVSADAHTAGERPSARGGGVPRDPSRRGPSVERPVARAIVWVFARGQASPALGSPAQHLAGSVTAQP